MNFSKNLQIFLLHTAKILQIFKLTDKSKQTSDSQQQEIGVFGSEGFGGVSQYSNQEILSEIDQMDPMEREFFMEELSARSDFWNQEMEVFYE